MGLLCDTYIFYADVYFLQNSIIKIAVLYLSLHMNKCHFLIQTIGGMTRIVLVAVLGTIGEIIGLWLSDSYNLFLVFVHLLEVPIMFFVLLGKRKQQVIKGILAGYFFIMVINATLEILWNWIGENSSFVFLLCVSCLFVCVAVGIYKNCQQMKKGIFQVELIHNNRCICSNGFYDSGNHLQDPYTGKGVHIISERLCKELKLEKEASALIPYQSLGNETGMLSIYYLDEIVIGEENKKSYWQKCPVGVTKENLFEGRQYEMILNEEVF